MAITGTKAFTSGEVLTANDVNQYLMRGVKVFASTAVRDAAYGGAGEPTLEEGETCYITGTDQLQVYNGSTWQAYPTTTQSGKVLQVAQTVKSDTFSTSSTSYTDVTGLSVSITPSAMSSKILVFANINLDSTGILRAIQLVRDTTAVYVGDAAGSRIRASYAANAGLADTYEATTLTFLDSPSTTSATTYKIQMRVASGTGTLNRSVNDTDNGSFARLASSITVMEISA